MLRWIRSAEKRVLGMLRWIRSAEKRVFGMLRWIRGRSHHAAMIALGMIICNRWCAISDSNSGEKNSKQR